tara:strand:+ start:735 stop:1229 length:495 start_codon:yes stop_codon:yes gene_type:complete
MKRKTRRRAKSGFNIVNALELYAQTSVLTQNIMGTNPFTALTGMESIQGSKTMTGTNQKTGQSFSYQVATTSYGYNPSAASVTLPELLGIDKRTSIGTVNKSVEFGQGLDVMKENFKTNLFPMIIQSIGVRAGFAIGKKLMSKQRNFINNKMLKPIGLKSVVTV